MMLNTPKLAGTEELENLPKKPIHPSEEKELKEHMKRMKELDKVSSKFNKELNNEAGLNEFGEEAPSRGIDATSIDISVAGYINRLFDSSCRDRASIEDRWLKDLRQYRGQYDPETMARLAATKRSRAYMRLTRTKVKTVDSRLTDFLFPANGDKNWSIDPTPIADLGPEMTAKIGAMVTQQTGKEMAPEQLELELQKVANAAADRMENQIFDQLAELKYREILREVLHSGNLYGTGILKGPMVSIKPQKKYKRDGDNWTLEKKTSLSPFIEAVPVWDIYPDMSVDNLDDARYIIQRHKMDKHTLVELGHRSDFNSKKIFNYLKNKDLGDFDNLPHENELQALGQSVSRTEGTQADPAISKKYEVLEFWGYLDASDLEELGLEIPEKLKGSLELKACVWILGNYVIKAALAPLDGVEWPYFFYYYDKDETSIFGEGIPSIMRDVQELINSAFRAMLDNAAISAGPQVEVNTDLIGEDEDSTDIRPFKVWHRHGVGLDAQSEAIRFFSPPSHTHEFLQMAEAFEKYGDEITTIPRYLWGDQAQGAGRTASGLSMMLGSANITIKDQVKNFDDGITKPFIEAMYHWNMQFNMDETIKGDFSIVAKGTSTLVAKEVYSNSLMNFANLTNNNLDNQYIHRSKVIREIAKSLDLHDKGLVLSEKEITAQNMQREKAQQEEKDFMLQMTEIAREHGVSPMDMIEGMRTAQKQFQPEQGDPNE